MPMCTLTALLHACIFRRARARAREDNGCGCFSMCARASTRASAHAIARAFHTAPHALKQRTTARMQPTLNAQSLSSGRLSA